MGDGVLEFCHCRICRTHVPEECVVTCVEVQMKVSLEVQGVQGACKNSIRTQNQGVLVG